MARKIVDITHSASQYDILSQTPGNYDKSNYFLKELQDKMDAEWNYRPNRADIEFETTWGEPKEGWTPINVVIQSVKSEKGTAISDDCKRIVFKDLSEKRFVIGSKFRFSPDYNIEEEEDNKNSWLATNMDRAKLTAGVIIERCNGTIGSLYVDEQNISEYHYEPVIQGKDLSAVNLFYNEVAVAPQSQLLIIAQHNKYTGQYKINQRFIIGYDKVYRIKAINKFYSNSTNKPKDIGLMLIYLEITDISVYDDFETRIAYQQEQPVHIVDEDSEEYGIRFLEPASIPSELGADPITFKPVVTEKDGAEYPSIPVTVTYSLDNLPATVSIDNYIEFSQSGNTFTLRRKRMYLNGNLNVKCSGTSPSGEPVGSSFVMVVSQP